MELEQLEKKIEWLDDERRKDKQTISDLQKRLVKMEKGIDKSTEFVKEVSGEVTRMGVMLAKVDEYDQALSAHRAEVKKQLAVYDTKAKQRDKDAKKKQDQTLEEVRKKVTDFNEGAKDLGNLREAVLKSGDQHKRQMGAVQEQIDALKTAGGDQAQALRSFQVEVKQLSDLQGEVSALRKRVDEHRGKVELISGGQKKVENRLNELVTVGNERINSQTAFTEKVDQVIDEQKKTWNNWGKRFDTIEAQSKNMDKSLQSVGEAEIAIRKARKDFDEINEQINRRIHEITEMQRLGEERFRQEWATYKTDDQKRWTNYALTQEEQDREKNRRLEGLMERTTSLEELMQDLQDGVQHLSEESEKLMQTILNGMRDWLVENERFESGVR